MLEHPNDDGTRLGSTDNFSRQLIQVVYRSRSLTDENGERDILEASRRNNPARGITGVLVSHGGWFMQVLEGPTNAVSDLIASIESDHRNGDFLLLRANPTERRHFGDWAMASTVVDAEQFILMLDCFSRDGTAASQMLSRFIMDGRWREQ